MKTITLLFALVSLSTVGFTQQNNPSRELELGSGIFPSYFEGDYSITKKEFKEKLFSNQKAQKEYKQGMTLSHIGRIAGLLSAGYLGYSLASDEAESTDYIVGGVGVGVGFGLAAVGVQGVKKSIKTYNNSL